MERVVSVGGGGVTGTVAEVRTRFMLGKLEGIPGWQKGAMHKTIYHRASPRPIGEIYQGAHPPGAGACLGPLKG